MKNWIILCWILLPSLSPCWSQTLSIQDQTFTVIDTIKLDNNSFEDVINRPDKLFTNDVKLTHWYDCGSMKYHGESPFTVHHPDLETNFGVQHKAEDGSNYISLVTRENDSTESMTQILKYPLIENEIYMVRLKVAQSSTMKSHVRESSNERRFNKPVIFQLIGSNTMCDEDHILYTSESITDSEWHEVMAVFKSPEKLDYLTIKVNYPVNHLFKTNGNLLIDRISDIYRLEAVSNY